MNREFRVLGLYVVNCAIAGEKAITGGLAVEAEGLGLSGLAYRF